MSEPPAASDCEHSFPDPYPAPIDQPGDCRHCDTSYQTAKRDHDGPSVRECAEADDAYWNTKHAGEGL